LNNKAKQYIEKLNLSSHPEGGFFKEVYRAEEKTNHLPERYLGDRAFSTSIYFLLEGNQFSSFHKLKSDELWHFYDGSSIKIYIINPQGNLIPKILGRKIESGEVFQIVIPHDHWFAAELIDKNSFALIGCTVAPGFEFADFELAEREKLISLFPTHSNLISRLTSK